MTSSRGVTGHLRCVCVFLRRLFSLNPAEDKQMDTAALCGENMNNVSGLQPVKCPGRREDTVFASLRWVSTLSCHDKNDERKSRLKRANCARAAWSGATRSGAVGNPRRRSPGSSWQPGKHRRIMFSSTCWLQRKSAGGAFRERSVLSFTEIVTCGCLKSGLHSVYMQLCLHQTEHWRRRLLVKNRSCLSLCCQARIKKIMQKDREVGRIAIAVPVIICIL